MSRYERYERYKMLRREKVTATCDIVAEVAACTVLLYVICGCHEGISTIVASG
jgi:hypothetical protein